MINKLLYYIGQSDNPYYNLAVEQYLMETVGEDCCILYLWQNRHTVVIGRNQNPWVECRTTELEQDGGHLARRLSGGGAVYHDMGNLNFTFLVSKQNYDLQKQLQVIVTACRNLGLNAEVSGRNDVLVEGRKFSGNAFYAHKNQAYHHGTLLIDVDMSKLGQYLMPSKAKLQSKGVSSVRARVVNLKELCPELTVERMGQEMLRAFEQVYGLSAAKMEKTDLDEAYIATLSQRNGSWDWLYGRACGVSFSCEDRFDWGGVEVQLQVTDGIIADAALHTDAMEWSISQQFRQAVLGRRFALEEMLCGIAAMDAPVEIRQDLSRLLQAQSI